MIFRQISVQSINIFGCADKYCYRLAGKYLGKSNSSLTNMIYETSLLPQRKVFIQTKLPNIQDDVIGAVMKLRGNVTIICRCDATKNYAAKFEKMGLKTNYHNAGICGREALQAEKDIINTSDVIFHESETNLSKWKSRINVIKSTYSRSVFDHRNLCCVQKKVDVTKSDYIIVDNMCNRMITNLTNNYETKVIYVLNEFKNSSLVHYVKSPKKNYKFITRKKIDEYIYHHYRTLCIGYTLNSFIMKNCYAYRKRLNTRISGVIVCSIREFKLMDSFDTYTAILFNLEDVKLAKRARLLDHGIKIFIVRK